MFSVGDQIVISDPIVEGGHRIGELWATCTFTNRARAPKGNSVNPGAPICTGAFVMKRGTLFVEAVNAGGKRTTGAVLGGTGAYVGARGTFVSTTTKSGNSDVVHLQG